jgi:hypothetical protein
MRILVGICVATLALGACQKAAETAEVAAPEKGPVPPGLDAAPLLKAGLWELTPEGVPMRAQSCIDEATQADSAALGQNLDRRYCTGAENGKTVSARQVVNARYSGACPVDMKPGDKRVVVNGQTLPIPAAEPAG